MATNVKINFITGSAAKVNLTSSNVIKATIKDRGPVGATGATGETGASITSAAFSSNDLIFTKDDANTVVLTNAKVDLKGDKGDKGDAGITEQTVGFTVTGGTTPKTLTVALDAIVSGTNTGDQTLPTKATGAELDNGTDDTKFSTAKALKDSHNVPSVAPGTSGNLLTSNGTDWTSSAPPVSVSVTTKGDLQTHDGTTPDRLPVGTDGYILESRASEHTGLKWIIPPTIPTKSTAAETDAVTDDAKFVTSLTARKLTAAPASDHLASGIKVVLNANENQAFGDVCYIDSDGQAHLGDADAIATASCVVMCADASISANADGNYLLLGFARDDSWNWTVGGLIYLTTTGTSGNTLSQTAPTGTDDVVQVLGVATHADRMYFNPQLNQPELS